MFSDSRKDWEEWWEKTRTRGYWASYFLIPIILFPIVLRSYERHDGHEWIWLLVGVALMVRAVVMRPR